MTNEFLSDLFGEQNGVVYSPVMGETWKQYFFEWPNERDQLESHLNDFSKRDVYVSPVLFKEKRITPETFKGTNYLWTEFDGQLPTESIEPTMRVMSSQKGHEHWYWKLDSFVTDKVLVEDLTKRIAYHYGADLSVWDYQNVLRPPDTWNYKRNKPVTLVSKNDTVYNVDKFLWIPTPPTGTRVDISLGDLPTREQILAKYKWRFDTLDLLFKDITNDRSTALVRIAFDAIEAGCSNEEAYVLLEERDSVWKKYVGRSDRDKQLKACISHARSKKALVAEIVQGTTEVYRFHDFMKTTIKLKWVIEGLLPVAGSMVIFGKPGVGKSTFALRMAMALSKGVAHFLKWKIVNRQRTMFISLEMQHDELKEFFKDMNFSEEEQETLQDWFHIWPIGHAYPFDTPDQQIELLKFIDLHKIELIIIDSVSLSMYGDVSNDNDVKRLNSFLNEDVRKARKCGYVLIHHPRKLKAGEEHKKLTLDDMFGSTYIGANAQTVISVSQIKGNTKVHIDGVKTRMSIGEKEFDIERTPDRGFQFVGSITPPVTATVNNDGGETTTDEGGKINSLGKLFTL
jgi:archaellum biogenesis ATPase FlaH